MERLAYKSLLAWQKKFIYKELKKGARAYAYEDAMKWLFDTIPN